MRRFASLPDPPRFLLISIVF
ncbi:hypothetical protein ROS217_00530 [Roseovarius sp. 217]|nr:hypothetical protein ROS217_00530 [Roseovarius sp. 217]